MLRQFVSIGAVGGAVGGAVTAVMLVAGTAHAEVRGVFRVGVEPLSLEPSTSTPYVGGYVDDAVTAYNAAATAYNRAHGYVQGSPMAASSIVASDLGLHATLLTLAPGLEVGSRFLKLRVEGLFGMSDHVRAVGVGLYPIDVAVPLPGVNITPYALVGGTLRYLSRSDTDGETGGLGTIRAAAGARFGHVMVELGVGIYMLGGLYNQGELESMARTYDPRGNAPPPSAERVVSGGTQSGMIDFSVGFTL
jgi:hypothetical protein